LTDATTGAGLKRRFRLYYSIDGGNSWNELGRGILGWGELWTDENGKFSSSWRPPGHLPYDYLLKAHWEGDETYDGCTVIQTLRVDLPGEVPLVIENVRSVVLETAHYIVGWIRNTGGDNLGYVKVAVGYYNATGDTIDAEIASIPTDILRPGQTSPFLFKRTPAAEVARYEVVVSQFSVTKEEPYVDFEFSGHRSHVEYGYHHVVGLVENTGSMNAGSVKVLAIFYDASDRLLGYGTGSALRSILTPGEESPFEASGSAAGTPHHYTLVVEAQNTTAQPCTYLQVVSHKGRIEYSSYRVSGEVKNIGLSCVEGVKVIAAFHDAEGNIVDCGYDSGDPSPVIPEQTSRFEVYTYTDIDKIHHYQLWAECTEKAWWYDMRASGMPWKVFITSNSSYVGDFSFDRQARAITFNVTGYSGIGWCRAVVPKQLLGGPFTVLVDGATVIYAQAENDTHTFLSFSYQHSEHKVEIVGTTVVKEASSISCSVYPASASYGEVSTTISGSISPLVDETKSVPVTIQYSPDGAVWLEIATVTSSSEARYEYVWNPTLTPGTYHVRAMWGGSTTYMNATSEAALFTVTKAKTTITCTISSPSLVIGDNITVSGSISPARAGVTLTISYASDGLWTTLTTVATASDGGCSHVWTPTSIGSYQLRASWEGDAAHLGATSDTKTVTVTKISTAISCTVSPPGVTEGGSVTISGSTSPAVSGKTVTLTYRRPDGTTFTRAVTTSPEGSYTDSYKPDATGSWSVTVSWSGDSTHEGASSSSMSFTVKTLTTITASVSKTTITEGDEIAVSGSIAPTPGAVAVTLTYGKPDGTSLTRTVTSTSAGAYTDTWRPAPKGSWSVAASWAGTETHEGATSSTVSFTVKEKGCIIATATYGSELSPEVQYLRSFRNNVVLSTFAGSRFMELFNAWYYSFSPGVAGFIAEHATAKSAMRVVLYPLIGILHLSVAANAASPFGNEAGVVVAGLVASSLIGIVYFTPPLTALLLAFKPFGKAIRAKGVKALLIAWLISLTLIFIGEVSLSPIVMMVAAGAFVLATLSLSATIGALSIAALAQKWGSLKHQSSPPRANCAS